MGLVPFDISFPSCANGSQTTRVNIGECKMTIKTKTIKLNRALDMDKSEVNKTVYRYKVVQVTDSLDYHPNDFISAEQAQELCSDKNWKVTIS